MSRQRRRAHQRRARRAQTEASRKDVSKQPRRARADRRSNRELASSSPHVIGHDCVDADAGQADGERRKEARDRQGRARPRQLP